MREVSIAVHRDFVKKRLIEILKNEIISSIPAKIKKNKSALVVPV
jgi:LysR family hydrogen peroxide-inducible transcriptional activator